MTNRYFVFRFLSLTFLVLLFLSPTKSHADTVTIAHGDQFIMTLNNSDTVKVEQTILFTSNQTVSAFMKEISSIDGSLVGEPTIIADSSIENAYLDWRSIENVTDFIVSVNVTLQPSKFKAVRLTYYLKGMLQYQNDDTWLYSRVFNMTAGSIAPPEVVVKVPKPQLWQDLKFQEMVPTPSSLFEEEGYYVMSWKSGAITFENTSVTFVRLRYSLTFNPTKVVIWFTPPFFGFVLGFISARLWELRAQIKSWFGRRLRFLKS